jgi:Domain of Unknown Function (DUF1206)
VATVERGARRLATSPSLELLERLGYVVRGTLYGVMGFLALRIALSQPGGAATDLTGSLVYLIGNSWGKLILLVAIVGLTAYSIWGFARAIFDPLHRGSDPTGWIERLGFVSSAISYGAIAIFGLRLLIGAGSGSTDSTKQAISSLLDHPAGGLLTILIGVIALGIGIGQFVEAYRATFQADLKGTEMTQNQRRCFSGPWLVCAAGRPSS